MMIENQECVLYQIAKRNGLIVTANNYHKTRDGNENENGVVSVFCVLCCGGRFSAFLPRFFVALSSLLGIGCKKLL